jgi:hypothetical protein
MIDQETARAKKEMIPVLEIELWDGVTMRRHRYLLNRHRRVFCARATANNNLTLFCSLPPVYLVAE